MRNFAGKQMIAVGVECYYCENPCEVVCRNCGHVLCKDHSEGSLYWGLPSGHYCEECVEELITE